jgi:hypothetical protein
MPEHEQAQCAAALLDVLREHVVEVRQLQAGLLRALDREPGLVEAIYLGGWGAACGGYGVPFDAAHGAEAYRAWAEALTKRPIEELVEEAIAKLATAAGIVADPSWRGELLAHALRSSPR